MHRAIFTLAVAVLMVVSASADVPTVISYQGSLTDGGGVPVTDGLYYVKFIIYDAPAAGTELWNSGFQPVTAEGGLFNYDLGSSMPLPDDIFTDTSRYLGITVGGDPELVPRTRLETAPYAYHALRADTALATAPDVGVTQAFDDGEPIITGYLNLMGVDSINCPSDGFVIVHATAGMNCNHTAGDDDVAFVVLTDSTFTITTDQDGHAWSLPSGLPSGLYGNPVHVHKVYPVSAGWFEVNLVGVQNAGGGTDNFTPQDVAISLLFVPETFGTVAVGSKSATESPLQSLPLKLK